MSILKKDIDKCKVLDKCNVNIEERLTENNKQNKKIGETEKYNIYEIRGKYNLYFIRQEKSKLNKIVSLGWFCDSYHTRCIFKNYIVMGQSGHAEVGMWDHFIFINVENGERKEIGLRSKYGNLHVAGGYGRRYNQDSLEKMYVNDDKLIMEFEREKYTDENADEVPENKEMKYSLIIDIINDRMIVIYNNIKNNKTIEFKL